MGKLAGLSEAVKGRLFKPWGSGSRRGGAGSMTALEIEGARLRVVTASGRGAISRAVAAPLELPASGDKPEAEAVGRAVAAALAKLGLRPGPVVMGVPRASVLLRTLVLPQLSRTEEMAAVVRLQLAKDLPYRLEDAVVDFQVGGLVKEESPPAAEEATDRAKAPGEPLARKCRVVAAVVRREVVDFYQQVARAAGVRLAHLGLVSHANARGVEACRLYETTGTLAIVTLREDEVGIDLVGDGALLFSRGASIRGSAPVEGAEGGGKEGGGVWSDRAVELATIEVVRSLHSFGGMGVAGSPVGRVVVAGNTGREADVVAALAARMALKVTLLDLGEALRLPSEARESRACSLSAAGLALGACDAEGLPFDFLNPKRPAAPRDNRRTILLLGSAAAAAVVVFLLGVRTHLVNQRIKVRQAVAAELADAKKKRPLYRQMKQQLATVEEWQRGARDWLEHYAYLSAVLPPSEEIYITSLSVSGAGSIRLAVRARSGAVLAKLDRDLRAAGYEVKPLAITPADEKHGYGFSSTVEIEVPSKLKIDLSKVSAPPRPPDDASLEPGRKGGAP